ncbi:MAG TPA: cobalamin biosynthesis protein CobW, partial [Eubacterium sp.]|nr:cobalamin biosynthesis protein CobW [Eubacterium sp.]
HEHHHHHHHADEVFESIGKETNKKFTKEKLDKILNELANNDEDYGMVLRSKGMLPCEGSDEWLYFDLTPGEYEIRGGAPDFTGKIVVIGSKLDKDALMKLFEL